MRPLFSAFSALVLGLSALAFPAFASTTTYECKLDQNKNNLGWLPEVLFIGHDTASGTVTVADPIILHFNDRQPVQGKVAVANDKRTTFTWRLDTKDASNRRATISYRATYLKASETLQVNAQPGGFADVFHAGGRCTVTTDN